LAIKRRGGDDEKTEIDNKAMVEGSGKVSTKRFGWD